MRPAHEKHTALVQHASSMRTILQAQCALNAQNACNMRIKTHARRIRRGYKMHTAATRIQHTNNIQSTCIQEAHARCVKQDVRNAQDATRYMYSAQNAHNTRVARVARACKKHTRRNKTHTTARVPAEYELRLVVMVAGQIPKSDVGTRPGFYAATGCWRTKAQNGSC